MFDIVEKRRWYFFFSAVLIALSIAAMIVSTVQFDQPMRLGIDFTGGSIFVIKFDQSVSEDDIREVFTGYGVESAIVQPLGAPEEHTWQVRTRKRQLSSKHV